MKNQMPESMKKNVWGDYQMEKTVVFFSHSSKSWFELGVSFKPDKVQYSDLCYLLSSLVDKKIIKANPETQYMLSVEKHEYLPYSLSKRSMGRYNRH